HDGDDSGAAGAVAFERRQIVLAVQPRRLDYILDGEVHQRKISVSAHLQGTLLWIEAPRTGGPFTRRPRQLLERQTTCSHTVSEKEPEADLHAREARHRLPNILVKLLGGQMWRMVSGYGVDRTRCQTRQQRVAMPRFAHRRIDPQQRPQRLHVRRSQEAVMRR